jgi:hypothetical protein
LIGKKKKVTGKELFSRHLFLFPVFLYALKSCRAITIRWISLVPSPIVQSLESRQYFSAG